jgi:hypothetical protein
MKPALILLFVALPVMIDLALLCSAKFSVPYPLFRLCEAL